MEINSDEENDDPNPATSISGETNSILTSPRLGKKRKITANETKEKSQTTEGKKEEQPRNKRSLIKLQAKSKETNEMSETNEEEKQDQPKNKGSTIKLQATLKETNENSERNEEEKDQPKIKGSTIKHQDKLIENNEKSETNEKEELPKNKGNTIKLQTTLKETNEKSERNEEEKEDMSKNKGSTIKLQAKLHESNEKSETNEKEEEENSTKQRSMIKLQAKLKETNEMSETNEEEKQDQPKNKGSTIKLQATLKETNEKSETNEKEELPKKKGSTIKLQATLKETNEKSETNEKEELPKNKGNTIKLQTTLKETNEMSETNNEQKEENPKNKLNSIKLQAKSNERNEKPETNDEEQPKTKRSKKKLQAKLKKTNVKSETNKKEKLKKPKNKRRTEKLSEAKLLLRKEQDELIKKYMPLKCDICLLDLSDLYDLESHFRDLHNRKGYVVCCKKNLRFRCQIVDHINLHNNPDYFKCTECGKVMTVRSSLQQHMLMFHPTEELKTFQCSYCPEKLASQFLLDLHSVKHVPKEKFTFICKECGKGFAKKSGLNCHMKETHSTAYYKMCEFCAKLFRRKSSFDRHVEEHAGIVHPRIQCTECDLRFQDTYTLQHHMRNKHTENKHICNICGKNSASRTALLSHINYMHEVTPIFKCSFCEKSFKKAIKRKEHEATHTGEVLYACPHCPKKFNASSNMYYHLKNRHRPEWEATRHKANNQKQTK